MVRSMTGDDCETKTAVSTTMPLRRCVSSVEPPEAHIMYTLHRSNVLFIAPMYTC